MLREYTTYRIKPYLCNVGREKGCFLPKLETRDPHQKERLKSEWNLITDRTKDIFLKIINRLINRNYD